MDNYLIALIMSLVEGATEFLPVSSTGHLILAGDLLNFHGEKAKTFEIIIQLGAILAVLWLYRKKVWDILRSTLSGKTNFSSQLNIIHITVAIIPAIVAGFLLHGTIKTKLFSPETVLIGLIVGSILLIIAEKKISLRAISYIDNISYRQAFSIGMLQCLSLWPGFSRAGATIAGGVIMGLSRKTAAEFSFIIAIPLMFAATGYDLLKSYAIFNIGDIPFLIVGVVFSFLAAWISVVWFLKFLERTSLIAFAVYRVVLAIVFWILFL